MKEILDQYGKTIVTVITVVIIIGIVSTVTFNGITGVIDIAARGSSKLADDDTVINSTVPEGLLDAQANTAIPKLQVAFHPVDHETLSVDRLINKNNNAGTVDIQPTMITTALNDSGTDAEMQGLVTINGKDITFTDPMTLYLTVDVRQDNRLMTQTFKIIVDKRPEPIYGFQKINGTWTYCRSEFNTDTRNMDNYALQTYPYSEGFWGTSTYSYRSVSDINPKTGRL